MYKIDSHQHFWQYDPDKHGWIDDEMRVLKRDFMPPDLKKELEKVPINGCVAVQAEQSEEETEFLLGLAEEYDFIKGVVGWMDLCDDDLLRRLEHYIFNSKLKGLRHVVQDEPDDRFLMRDEFLKGIKKLIDFDLTYDILIFARHLPVAIEFANIFPDQKFVLDHIGKPEIKEGNITNWEKGIRELAQHPLMYCKVSGIITEADLDNWNPDNVRPYLDVVFDAFGTDRLMFGSDWPVCTLAGSYEDVYRLVSNYIDEFSEQQKEMILGGNAKQFYDL